MKTCCDEYCSTHGCNQGRDCPVRKTPMVDGGNFWYQPEEEQMTTGDSILLAIIFALCFASLYGAVRFYWPLIWGLL